VSALGLALVLSMTGIAVVEGSLTRKAAAAPPCQGTHWVGAWAAAPGGVSLADGKDAPPPLEAQTVRMVVHPTIGGHRVRVRLSHRYGAAPALVTHATLGVRRHGAAAVPRSVRTLRFHAQRSVRLAPGQDILSDPVSLRFRRGQDLLVSLHLPHAVGRPTQHAYTNQTNYLSARRKGDHAADTSGRAFGVRAAGRPAGWYFLSGVDVRAPRRTHAVVAIGDSITDGVQRAAVRGQAVAHPNTRYTDFLSDRLAVGRARPRMSVLNGGIGGNRVLSAATPPRANGAAALDRFRADALQQAGVTDVIIIEGINDLGTDQSLGARALIDALWLLVRQAQMAGLRVHLGTLTPAFGARQGESQGSLTTERRRQLVNRWIRASGVADGVVDFDRAVRDPAQPARLRPVYDSGDHLHPSTAGYRAMARAVRLSELTRPVCAERS